MRESSWTCGGVRVRIVAATCGVVLLLAAPATGAARCADPGTAAGPAAQAATVLCAVNAERDVRDLPRLRRDGRLERIASDYAATMVRDRFFGHTGPGGRTLADRIIDGGYLPARGAWSAGEVLAWGAGSAATPQSRVNAWMRSREHREILLDPGLREAGVGVEQGTPRGKSEPDGATYVMELGTRTLGG